MSSKNATDLESRIEREIRGGGWLREAEVTALLELLRLLATVPSDAEHDDEYSPFVYPH